MHNDPNMTGLEQQVDNDCNSLESSYVVCNVSCAARIVTRRLQPVQWLWSIGQCTQCAPLYFTNERPAL